MQEFVAELAMHPYLVGGAVTAGAAFLVDNRWGHRRIWTALGLHRKENTKQLLDIYKQVGGKPNGEKHWQKEEE